MISEVYTAVKAKLLFTRARGAIESRDGANINAMVDFIKFSNVTNRYMDGHKEIWGRWADLVTDIYALDSNPDMKPILTDKLTKQLSAHQHVAIAEYLWGREDGSNRSGWLVELLDSFWNHDSQDADRKKDFRIFVNSSSIFPAEIKQRYTY